MSHFDEQYYDAPESYRQQVRDAQKQAYEQTLSLLPPKGTIFELNFDTVPADCIRMSGPRPVGPCEVKLLFKSNTSLYGPSPSGIDRMMAVSLKDIWVFFLTNLTAHFVRPEDGIEVRGDVVCEMLRIARG